MYANLFCVIILILVSAAEKNGSKRDEITYRHKRQLLLRTHHLNPMEVQLPVIKDRGASKEYYLQDGGTHRHGGRRSRFKELQDTGYQRRRTKVKRPQNYRKIRPPRSWGKKHRHVEEKVLQRFPLGESLQEHGPDENQFCPGKYPAPGKPGNGTCGCKSRKNCPKKISLGKQGLDVKEKIDTVIVPLLKVISHQLSEMKAEDSALQKKNNVPCSINGVWISTANGLRIKLTTLKNTMLRVTQCGAYDHQTKGVIDGDWTLQGLALSSAGGPFVLVATCPGKKKIASFIGQCRTCNGENTIVGSWLSNNCVNDCSDLTSMMEVHADVFRRENSTSLRNRKTTATVHNVDKINKSRRRFVRRNRRSHGIVRS